MFTCNSCGTIYNKWSGKCEGCQQWNTITQEISTTSTSKRQKVRPEDIFTPLKDVEDQHYKRLLTGISEFDRVTGGGLVPGSVILLGGHPGIGKSTLMLQILARLSQKQQCVYVSGEEGLAQIKMRAGRLQVDQHKCVLSTCTNVTQLTSALEQTPNLGVVIVDSIQTMSHPDVDAAPGTVSQVRAASQTLIDSAKRHNYVMILIGHVTKDGVFAGPKLLEHMVDTVLYFDGDGSLDYRILRTIKNRFGATNEIGVFEMGQEGLVEITNPSSIFLSQDKTPVSGTAIAVSMEGTRPILCEIQTLISPSFLASPRRVSIGYDNNRLSMLTAVLISRCKLPLGDKDIYVNIAGGLSLKDTAADLAIVAALISSLKNEPLSSNTVYCGEIALSGQVRPVRMLELRLKEAEKLGFEALVCADHKLKAKSIDLRTIAHVFELK